MSSKQKQYVVPHFDEEILMFLIVLTKQSIMCYGRGVGTGPAYLAAARSKFCSEY